MHTLSDIRSGLIEVVDLVHVFGQGLSEEAFMYSPSSEKWSTGQNLEHLLLSTKPLAKTMALPKLTLKAFGKPNRPGRTYEALVQRYLEKLAQTQVSPPSGFQPKAQSAIDKELLLQEWKKAGDRLVGNLPKWKEKDLDAYLLPHPLLGKLTVREMLFFTHYHTLHHLAIMKDRTKNFG